MLVSLGSVCEFWKCRCWLVDGGEDRSECGGAGAGALVRVLLLMVLSTVECVVPPVPALLCCTAELHPAREASSFEAPPSADSMRCICHDTQHQRAASSVSLLDIALSTTFSASLSSEQ